VKRLRTVLALALLVTLVAPAAARAEDLLYYLDAHGQVVFTNTPSRSDVKPVPHLRGGPAQRSVTLPATPYDRYIESVARDNGVDPSLVKAVALVESGFNPRATSRAGAAGLMQLMPATAAQHGVQDVFRPRDNIEGGVRHLKWLLDRYGGNVPFAVAAYNAGHARVEAAGGIPNIPETREYLARVIRYRDNYRREKPAKDQGPGVVFISGRR
jgi:soluble lytic murein transglycosylase-like protein